MLGESGVYNELESLSKTKKIDSKEIYVKNISKVDEIENYADILFISNDKRNLLKESSNSLYRSTCVIITDFDPIELNGAMVSLSLKDNKLSFKLNNDEFKRKNIKINNQLIKWSE